MDSCPYENGVGIRHAVSRTSPYCVQHVGHFDPYVGGSVQRTMERCGSYSPYPDSVGRWMGSGYRCGPIVPGKSPLDTLVGCSRASFHPAVPKLCRPRGTCGARPFSLVFHRHWDRRVPFRNLPCDVSLACFMCSTIILNGEKLKQVFVPVARDTCDGAVSIIVRWAVMEKRSRISGVSGYEVFRSFLSASPHMQRESVAEPPSLSSLDIVVLRMHVEGGASGASPLPCLSRNLPKLLTQSVAARRWRHHPFRRLKRVVNPTSLVRARRTSESEVMRLGAVAERSPIVSRQQMIQHASPTARCWYLAEDRVT